MRTNQSGFSLIELLVSVLLMGVLLAVGVPSMVNMVKDSRLSSAAYRLAGDLNLARSEAVRTGQRTVFCHAETAGTQCRTAAQAGGWQDSGYLVGLDNDSNQQIDNDATTGGPNPMRRGSDFGSGIKINPPTDVTFDTAIWFLPDGSIRDSTGRRGSATFQLCATDANAEGRVIEVSMTGAVSIDKTDTVIQGSAC
ncbi:MAG: GspH/FimT family pseudopilin [Pseudomonadota bacterium]